MSVRNLSACLRSSLSRFIGGVQIKWLFYPPGSAAEVSGRVSRRTKLLGAELEPPNTETDERERHKANSAVNTEKIRTTFLGWLRKVVTDWMANSATCYMLHATASGIQVRLSIIIYNSEGVDFFLSG